MENRNINLQLDRARHMLAAASSNEEIKQRLAGCGYAETQVQGGLMLYNRCIELQAATHSARFAKKTSTKATLQMRQHLDMHYQALARVARTLFVDQPEVLDRLGLVQRWRTVVDEPEAEQDTATAGQPTPRRVRFASRTQALVLARARTLYDGILQTPNLQQLFAEVGYTAQRLQHERAYLEALERSDVLQEQSKAASKAQTAELQAAVEALAKWLSRFSGIAGAALADRPDLLEYMGIKQRGRRASA